MYHHRPITLGRGTDHDDGNNILPFSFHSCMATQRMTLLCVLPCFYGDCF